MIQQAMAQAIAEGATRRSCRPLRTSPMENGPRPRPGRLVRRNSKLSGVVSAAKRIAVSSKRVTDPQCTSKPVRPGQTAGPGRGQGPLTRSSTLAGGGPVLMMTAQFGRSSVRDAAYRLRDRHPDLDLRSYAGGRRPERLN